MLRFCQLPTSLPESDLSHRAGQVLVVVFRRNRAESHDNYTYAAVTIAVMGRLKRPAWSELAHHSPCTLRSHTYTLKDPHLSCQPRPSFTDYPYRGSPRYLSTCTRFSCAKVEGLVSSRVATPLDLQLECVLQN
jgi:hypothetical protein